MVEVVTLSVSGLDKVELSEENKTGEPASVRVTPD